jgi:hypothetical protein
MVWGIWAKAIVVRWAPLGREMCKTNPTWTARRANAQNKPNPADRRRVSGGGRPTRKEPKRAEQSQFRAARGRLPWRSVRNEPNLARLGRVTEESVQNEAKLGGTGVLGQRVPYGPWPGRGVKHAKRTQFADCGLKDVARGRPTPDQVGGRPYEEAKRAKRTQFRPPGVRRRRRNVQDEANWEVSSCQFEVSGVRSERACARASRVAGHAAAVGQVSPRVPGSGVLDKPSGLPGLSKRASGDGDPQRGLSRLGIHARPPIRSGAGSAKSMGRAPSAGRAVRRDGGVVGIRWQSVRPS